jgi:sec-independent protein translocase protein TatA
MGLDNPVHILLLLVVVLLVFGAKRLPEIGRSLGDGMRGFKHSLNGESELHHSVTLPPAPGAPVVAPAAVPAVDLVAAAAALHARPVDKAA